MDYDIEDITSYTNKDEKVYYGIFRFDPKIIALSIPRPKSPPIQLSNKPIYTFNMNIDNSSSSSSNDN